MKKSEIKKRLTAQKSYYYTNKKILINNEHHYQVIETVDTVQGFEELKQFADREGYVLAGGSFTESSMPADFETNYQVIATNIVQKPISNKKIARIEAIYKTLVDNLGKELTVFIQDKPITLKELAFTNEALEFYLAKTDQLERIDKECIMTRLEGGTTVRRGGYEFDYTEFLNNYITKLSDGRWYEIPAFCESSIQVEGLEVLKVVEINY